MTFLISAKIETAVGVFERENLNALSCGFMKLESLHLGAKTMLSA